MRAFFVIVWFGLLCLPVAQMVYPMVQERPMMENRVLAKLPPMSADALLSPGATLRDVYRWFNDNFGFRITLTRVRTEINYAFRYSERVHITKFGWLYYRSVLDGAKVENARLSDEEIGHIADRFAKLHSYFASRGMRLLVVSVPQKDALYFYAVPKDAPRFRPPFAFDRLRDALNARLGSDHIDGAIVLRAAQARGLQTYHRTDFHWTDPAGGEVGRAVVNRIAALEGDESLQWTAEIPTRQVELIGGESQELPLFSPLWEKTVAADIDWRSEEFGRFQWKPEAGIPLNLAFPLTHSFEWKAKAEVGKLPAAAFITNSYGESFWRSGVHQRFRELHSYRRVAGPEWMARTIAAIPSNSRYVVFEFHEAEMRDVAIFDWMQLR